MKKNNEFKKRPKRMKFLSCRGAGDDDAHVYTFSEAVLQGYAADGGMLVPEQYPRIASFAAWRSLSYVEIVIEMLALYAAEEDIPRAELESIVHAALSKARFTTGAGDGGVLPLRTVRRGDGAPDLTIAECWHGPTLAFKDLGLQVLGGILEYLLRRTAKRSVLLVGTSGDTGSAAIECVRGMPNVHIIVLYPLGRVSKVQEQQMTTVEEANVHVVAVEGTSDDLDVPCNEVFGDVAFKTKHAIGSINSINVVRVVVQAAHHAFCAVRGFTTVVVPTGAAGNLVSGLWARAMGVPLTLVAAVNENDVFARFINRGELHANPAGAVATNTPSMDIVMPYNVERILHLLSGGDAAQTRAWFCEFLERGHLALPDDVAALIRAAPTSDGLGLGLTAYVVNQADVLATMRSQRTEGGASTPYYLDPHTAVGVAALDAACAVDPAVAAAARDGTVACLACAHVAKFAPTLAEALGVPLDGAGGAVALLDAGDAARFANVRKVLALQSAPRVRCATTFRRAAQPEWGAELRAIVEGLVWVDR